MDDKPNCCKKVMQITLEIMALGLVSESDTYIHDTHRNHCTMRTVPVGRTDTVQCSSHVEESSVQQGFFFHICSEAKLAT
jgi:hypothetical protein